MTLKDLFEVLYFDTRIILIDSEEEIYTGQLGCLPFQHFTQNKDKQVKNISIKRRGDLDYEVIQL